jgi:predicted membrane protein
MIIAIAGTFFLRNVGVVPDGAIGTWWPLFVVLFGILIMINRSRRRQRIRLEGPGDIGEVSVVSVFGSDDRRITTDRFTGAELVAVFGDSELDLHDANGRTRPAIAEVVSVFGDVELRVPSEWKVRLDTVSVIGDVIDRRPRQSTEPEADQEPDLIVTGVAFFGEIEIRD